LMTKNWRKKIQLKFNPERMSKLREKPTALKRGHPALRKMGNLLTFFYFCWSFLPSWIRIQGPIESVYGSGSTKLKKNSENVHGTGAIQLLPVSTNPMPYHFK
jgi:hypothetical protein